jgi:hypothetical protein
MKRFLVSILLMVYFTVSTGFAISLHYCMDRLASAELGASSKDTCGNCGMHVEDNGGCCRDEVQVVKLSTDHFASQYKLSFQQLQVPAVLPASFFEIIAPSFTSHTKEITAHSPPLPAQEDIYLRNCVFRI